MADPAETDGYTMLSFYRFSEISVPEDIAQALTELWKPFKTYGESVGSKVSNRFFILILNRVKSSAYCYILYYDRFEREFWTDVKGLSIPNFMSDS